jgi:uncharacterized protein (TIGR00288 family)
MPMEPNVAVLVDCENAQPAVIDHAMQIASTLGRVALRRGYGNHTSLASKWQDALIRHGFAPCLQFQYVNGKNTADIALALDALEMLLDRRVDQFVIVTSDSDFVGLCRKLQERGACVHVVGEKKSPAALRHACNGFHEMALASAVIEPPHTDPVAENVVTDWRLVLIKTVRRIVKSSPNGMVNLSELGNQLKKSVPGFSPSANGHTKLRTMVEACEQLRLHQTAGGHCSVSIVPKAITASPPTLHAA